MPKKIAPTHRPSATRRKHHTTIFAAPKRPFQPVPCPLSGTKSVNSELYFNQTLQDFWPAELPEGLTKQQQKTWKLGVLSYWLRFAHGSQTNG